MAIVTATRVKELTPLDRNLDDSLIDPFIEQAEVMHLYDPNSGVIPKALYDDVIDTDSSNQANNALLLPYIEDFVSRMVYYEMLPHLGIQSTTQGLMRNRTENSDSVGVKEISYIRREVKSTAEVFKRRLVAYLDDNRDDYPLWVSEENGNSDNEFYGHYIY